MTSCVFYHWREGYNDRLQVLKLYIKYTATPPPALVNCATRREGSCCLFLIFVGTGSILGHWLPLFWTSYGPSPWILRPGSFSHQCYCLLCEQWSCTPPILGQAIFDPLPNHKMETLHMSPPSVFCRNKVKQQKQLIQGARKPNVFYVWLRWKGTDMSRAMQPINCKTQSPVPMGVSTHSMLCTDVIFFWLPNGKCWRPRLNKWRNYSD